MLDREEECECDEESDLSMLHILRCDTEKSARTIPDCADDDKPDECASSINDEEFLHSHANLARAYDDGAVESVDELGEQDGAPWSLTKVVIEWLRYDVGDACISVRLT